MPEKLQWRLIIPLSLVIVVSMTVSITSCSWFKKPSIIYLDSSTEVVFIEPGQVVSVDYPAVILHRGRYLELLKHEFQGT